MDSTIFETKRVPEEKPGDGPPRLERRRPRVLAVDDDRAILQLIRTVLSADYELTLAPDGHEALRLAVAAPPDIILSDFNMPGMSGRELLLKVRAQPALEAIPLIVVTAVEDHQLRLQLLREGAQDFLVKPFLVEELRVRVKNLVHMKMARDLLQEELDSRSNDVELLIAELAARRAALQVALEQAEKASRAKSDFLTMVSHELRTPLTVLRLGTDQWRRKAAAADAVWIKELERFDGATRRLESIVDRLLEAARIQSGRLELRIAKLDLRELADHVALTLEPQLNSKGLTLQVDVTDEARWLTSDARLVELIVSNLLENAIKYTDQGVIELRAFAGAGTVLEVRDRGRGIEGQDAHRIFEPFVHLERLENKSTPGIGLGLALVRDLVAALGGQVALQSEVGVGSTFSVTLPVA
jgi:signal transduction histidine kinase